MLAKSPTYRSLWVYALTSIFVLAQLGSALLFLGGHDHRHHEHGQTGFACELDDLLQHLHADQPDWTDCLLSDLQLWPSELLHLRAFSLPLAPKPDIERAQDTGIAFAWVEDDRSGARGPPTV